MLRTTNFNIPFDVSCALDLVFLLSEKAGLSSERSSDCLCQSDDLPPPLGCGCLLGRDQVLFFCVRRTWHGAYHPEGKCSVHTSGMDTEEEAVANIMSGGAC